MNATYLPTTSPDQWAALLAEPVKHWRTGYSARALAYCWHEANGFPVEIQDAFRTTNTLSDIEMLLALPEHQDGFAGRLPAISERHLGVGTRRRPAGLDCGRGKGGRALRDDGRRVAGQMLHRESSFGFSTCATFWGSLAMSL